MSVASWPKTAAWNWTGCRRASRGPRAAAWASPSAVSGHNDTDADLLHSVSGNYYYLNDSTGLIHVYDYASSTTATMEITTVYGLSTGKAEAMLATPATTETATVST